MSLVRSLNQLLNALDLPFVIETPTDLTPSLLLAILASILCEPIHGPDETSFDDTIVTLTDLSQSHDTLPAFKVKQMKILLGVLNDVLPVDVCLSDVDPRRLAKGEWEEVKFVGELFVWLGKKLGRIPGGASDHTTSSEDAHAGLVIENEPLNRRRGGTLQSTRGPPSPTYTTSTNASRDPTNLSMRSFTSSRIEIETVTSPPSTSDSVETAVPNQGEDFSDNLEPPNANTSISHRPWCIHELKIEPTDIIPVYSPTGTSFYRPASPSNEYDFRDAEATSRDAPKALPDVFSCELTTCYCSSSPYPHLRPATTERGFSVVDHSTPDASPRRPQVRHAGYITHVDEDSELSWFEASRHLRSQSIDFGDLPRTPSRRPNDKGRLSTSQRSTPNVAQRIRLMEERAELLAQLALTHARAGV